MRYSHLVSLAAGLACLTASPARAQTLVRTDTPAAEPLSHGVALQELDGELVACGPRYLAKFEDERVVFVPAMPTAPAIVPMNLSVTGYGRGSAHIAAGDARRNHDGLRVQYHREGFVERYDVRRGGIEQSFVFDRLPAGRGDLTVRVALDTELVFAGRDHSGLQFLHGDHGGVTIGAVTGIDANGEQVTGAIAFEAGALTLSLPESFVERAALPLVLDPVLSPAVPINTTSLSDHEPDVAYASAHNSYLVVWRRVLSASNAYLFAQRLDDDGNLVGPGIAIIAVLNFNPRSVRVACANGENMFIVAYVAQSGFPLVSRVYTRGVRASDGAVTAVSQVTSTTQYISTVDIGGNGYAPWAPGNGERALVIWHNATAGQLFARPVIADASSMTVSALTQNMITLYAPSAGVNIGSISISASSRGSYRYMVAWSESFIGNPATVRALVCSDSPGVLQQPFTVSTSGDNRAPSVDGDGEHWVVAWQTRANTSTTDYNIAARAFTRGDIALTTVPLATSPVVMVEAGFNDIETSPSVAWLGESAAITFKDNVSGSYDHVYLQNVDPYSCLDCVGPRSHVYNTATNTEESAVLVAGANGEAVVAFAEVGTSADIFAQHYQVDDSEVQSVSLGCGSSRLQNARVRASCAVTGFSQFRSRIFDAPPNTLAFLVISGDTINFSCGACVLVPNPFTGVIVPRTLDSYGNNNHLLAIPADTALVGMQLYEQWLVLESNPECTMIGASMSGSIKITIQ